MNYINISKKRLVGRNNQQLSNQFIVDYSTVEDVSFQIINDQNQIQSITDQDGFYLAGSIGIGKQSYELLFLSKNYTISSGNTITFSVDTYTTPYLNSIKKKYTEINLEIGQETSSSKKVILRDFALACPRVYVDGVPPSGDLNKYYTKEEIEEILSSDYWTKQQVASAIADIETMDIDLVQELPPISSAQEYTIYLVPAEDSEIGNFYDEFLVINGAYEKVGSTAIDMSQYAMKSELSDYLPLSGGEISGAISCPSGVSLNVDGTIGKFVQGYAVGSTEWNNTGTASFATGTSKVTGNYSFAAGDNNTVQGSYCSALGRTNTVLGLYSMGAGLTNTVAGAYNFAFGYACGTTVQQNYCLVAGNYSYAGDNCQLVTGRYNVSTTGARVTGNGTSTTNRKNIEVLDWDGNLTLAGHITIAGKQNITLSSLSGIIPSEGKVMKYTLSADDEISFDSTSLTANNTVDFELQLIQPSTAVTVTFPQGIMWGEDGHFSSSNSAPDLTTGNTLYDFSIRWNGTRFLINLAYTEEIGQ